MTIPDDGLTRVQRAAAAFTDYTAANKNTYDLFDRFYAGTGRLEVVRPAQTVADYYGVPVGIFNTMCWRLRSTRILNLLATRADAVGFWAMTGGQRDRARAQIIANFLDDIGTGREP